MYNSIRVMVDEDTGSDPHFYIERDGVIRTLHKDKAGHVLSIVLVSNEGDITDAQCQSAVSLVLASRVTYSIAAEAFKCIGIKWEELLRRG